MNNQSKPRRKRPKSIVIVGRRWFDKTYGNTYFTSEVFIDGELWNDACHSISYGYGDQYAWDTFTKIEENKHEKYIIPKRERHDNGNIKEAFWQYSERTGIKVSYTATDVSRKKDLTHY